MGAELWSEIGDGIGAMIDAGSEIVTRNMVGTRFRHFDQGTNMTRDRWGNNLADRNILASLIAAWNVEW